ncbi:putative acyl-CoA thioester hydrolase [Fundidesulfovibrio magnetotacticus]|uniref:Putative acyl-CoA thioester hydrolase n=2 Tax=Fundidesulfovibrio magnetotacticus TaxID=2730080 RepID=A0A6V8LS69_9BACT|nr:putative acyl-CoA thioester hydrolase [Fundidesulfovibrio magnetotacticus]
MPVRVLPQDLGADGRVTPGTVLRGVDLAAAMPAMRHARGRVVTVSLDRMDFFCFPPVGRALLFKCRVNQAGRSSMEVGVRVEAEDLATGEVRHTATAYATFVAMGPDGKPAAVPQLLPETPDEERRVREALERRALRKAERGRTAGEPFPGDIAPPTGPGRSPEASRTDMPVRMMPWHANPAGNVHGGVILLNMDQAAAMAAMRHAGLAVEAVSVQGVSFLAPGRVDEVLTFRACVERARGPLMDVGVEVMAENLVTGESRRAAEAWMVYRGLDAHGAPGDAPALIPGSAQELERWREARRRGEARDAERARERDSQAGAPASPGD